MTSTLQAGRAVRWPRAAQREGGSSATRTFSGNARGSSGQDHNAVGAAPERRLLGLDLPGEPEEATRQHQQDDETDCHRQEADGAGETCKHQSIISSVLLTVCRDVKAVTPAISST